MLLPIVGTLILTFVFGFLISKVYVLQKKLNQLEYDTTSAINSIYVLVDAMTVLMNQMQINFSGLSDSHGNLRDAHLEFQKSMADFCTFVARFIKQFPTREDDPFGPPRKGSENKSN